MAYTKHTWVPRETISSARLNAMEDGIEAAHALAENAQDAQELWAAFGLLETQAMAAIRDLDARLAALEAAES